MEPKLNTSMEQMPSPKTRAKVLVSLAVIVLVIVGSIVYYTWPRSDADDTPPSLELATDNLQGAFISDKGGFYTVEESDVKVFEDNKVASLYTYSAPVEKGLHFYYMEDNQTVGNIIEQVEPIAGNQLVAAYYDLDGDEWKVYPKGPYKKTKTVEKSQVIPAYRGFVLVSKMDTKVIGAHDEKKPAKKFKFPKSNDAGWVLIPAVPDVKVELAKYKDRIDYIWVQDAKNNFSYIESVDKLTDTQGYVMIWLKVTEKVSVS